MDDPLGDPALLNHYLAGLFDGSGGVKTAKISIQGKYEIYMRIRMSIFILSNSKELMYLLTEHAGGLYAEVKGKRSGYCWRIWGKEKCLDFLNRIKDHVITKREQVKLALQFCETLPNDKPIPLTKAQHGLREIVHAGLQRLKE